MLCFVRIGVSLTYGILCSIGAAWACPPMIVKGSGVFKESPDLFSKPGLIVMVGMAIMLLGVVFASLAGAGREKIQDAIGKIVATNQARRWVCRGIVMVVLAGVFSVGWGCAFTYSQGPIIQAMKSHGAGDFPAGIAVWAVALLGAAIPNVLYPAVLMTRNNRGA